MEYSKQIYVSFSTDILFKKYRINWKIYISTKAESQHSDTLFSGLGSSAVEGIKHWWFGFKAT